MGSSCAVRGLWFEQSHGNLVGSCTPRSGLLVWCLGRISREEEERGLHSVIAFRFIPYTKLVSECGDARLTACESGSGEGGMLEKINGCSGESVTVCLVKRTNWMDLSTEG